MFAKVVTPRQRAIVFYDGGCGLCRREIRFYRRCDRQDAVQWVDINQDMSILSALGVTYDHAMRRFHVLDRNGVLQDGAPAFLAMWRELPLFWLLSELVYRTRSVSVLDRIYCRFAAWRYRSREPAACNVSREPVA